MTVYLLALLLITYGLSVAVDASRKETRQDRFNICVFITCIIIGMILIVTEVM